MKSQLSKFYSIIDVQIINVDKEIVLEIVDTNFNIMRKSGLYIAIVSQDSAHWVNVNIQMLALEKTNSGFLE